MQQAQQETSGKAQAPPKQRAAAGTGENIAPVKSLRSPRRGRQQREGGGAGPVAAPQASPAKEARKEPNAASPKQAPSPSKGSRPGAVKGGAALIAIEKAATRAGAGARKAEVEEASRPSEVKREPPPSQAAPEPKSERTPKKAHRSKSAGAEEGVPPASGAAAGERDVKENGTAAGLRPGSGAEQGRGRKRSGGGKGSNKEDKEDVPYRSKLRRRQEGAEGVPSTPPASGEPRVRGGVGPDDRPNSGATAASTGEPAGAASPSPQKKSRSQPAPGGGKGASSIEAGKEKKVKEPARPKGEGKDGSAAGKRKGSGNAAAEGAAKKQKRDQPARGSKPREGATGKAAVAAGRGSGAQNTGASHSEAVHRGTCCHHCQRGEDHVQCRNCLVAYCAKCLKRHYPHLAREESAERCPKCRGICVCKKHLRVDNSGMQRMLHDLGIGQDPEFSPEQEKWFANYVWRNICAGAGGGNLLLQLLKEETADLALGGKLPVDVPEADLEKGYRVVCSNCHTSIASVFRSCTTGCGLDLCLDCARECRESKAGAAASPGGGPSIVEPVPCIGVGPDKKPCKGELGLYRMPRMEEDLLSTTLAHALKPSKLGEWQGALDSRPVPAAEIRKFMTPKLQFKFKSGLSPVSQKAKSPDRKFSGQKFEQDHLSKRPDMYRHTPAGFVFCPRREDLGSPLSGLLGATVFDVFQSHWRQGRPVVVRNVRGLMCWTPDLISRATRQTPSNEIIDVTDCQVFVTGAISIHQFFKAYKGQMPEPAMWKLRDWPPSEAFVDRRGLKRLYYDFVDMLPLQEYTHPKGPLNLVRSFPEKSGLPLPDLGPKCSIACGRLAEETPKAGFLQSDGDVVSKLHYEIADTINVMIHVEDEGEEPSEGRTGTTKLERHEYGQAAAVWHIFQREDVPKLKQFLSANTEKFQHGAHLPPEVERDAIGSKLPPGPFPPKKVQDVVDPIHDQKFYLSTQALEKLKKDKGIVPWEIEQYKGEAVMVPAGCPCQVRNLKSCMKIAMDFVSPESSAVIMDYTRSLAKLPKDHPHKQDKLQGRLIVMSAGHSAVTSLLNSRKEGKPSSTAKRNS